MKLQTKTEIMSFLGKQVIQEYLELFPIMAYGLMRLGSMVDSSKEIYHEPFIRDYDYYESQSPQKITHRAAHTIYNPIFRAFNQPIISENSLKECVLLSQTFVLNQRYWDVLKSLSPSRSCKVFLGGPFEKFLINKHSMKATISRLFFKTQTGIAPIYDSQSLLPQSYLEVCSQWFETTKKIYQKNLTFIEAYDEIKPYCDRMIVEQRLALKRVKGVLQANHVRLYITINPFYLSEIITIMACNQMNIVCRNIEHHTSQFGFLPQTEPFFIHHIYLWNEAERLYRNENMKYEYMMTPEDRQPQIDICGILELSLQKMNEYQKKYKQKPLILFALPTNNISTDDGRRYYRHWCHTVYEQLNLLQEKTGIAVRIRYYPDLAGRSNRKSPLYDEYHMDDELIRKYGFEVSKSKTTNLMEDLFEASILMTAGSTIAVTGAAIGRQVYQIFNEQFPTKIYDQRILGVKPEEIANITIQSRESTEKSLDPDQFLRLDEVLKPACSKDYPQ